MLIDLVDKNIKCPQCGATEITKVTVLDRKCTYCSSCWCIEFIYKNRSYYDDRTLLLLDCGDCDKYQQCFSEK